MNNNEMERTNCLIHVCFLLPPSVIPHVWIWSFFFSMPPQSTTKFEILHQRAQVSLPPTVKFCTSNHVEQSHSLTFLRAIKPSGTLLSDLTPLIRVTADRNDYRKAAKQCLPVKDISLDKKNYAIIFHWYVNWHPRQLQMSCHEPRNQLVNFNVSHYIVIYFFYWSHTLAVNFSAAWGRAGRISNPQPSCSKVTMQTTGPPCNPKEKDDKKCLQLYNST